MVSCGRLFVFFLVAAALAMAAPASSVADVGALRGGRRHLAAPVPAPAMPSPAASPSKPSAASPARHVAKSPSSSLPAGAAGPSSKAAPAPSAYRGGPWGPSHAPPPSASAGASWPWSSRTAPAAWSPSYAPSQAPPRATDDGAKGQPPIGATTTTPGQPADTGPPATTRPGVSSGAAAGVPAMALTAAGVMAMMMLF